MNAKSTLRQRIREFVSLNDSVQLTTSEVATSIMAQFPADVKQESTILIRRQLENMAAKIMNSHQVSAQLVLPGIAKPVEFSARFPIRSGPKNGPAVWMHWHNLNLSQLEQLIKSYTKTVSVNKDLEGLKKLRKRVRELIASDTSKNANQSMAEILGFLSSKENSEES